MLFIFLGGVHVVSSQERRLEIECPSLGAYEPILQATGYVTVVPTIIPGKPYAYSCLNSKELRSYPALFIYNSNVDVTFHKGNLAESITNNLAVPETDVVYLDIIATAPVVISRAIKAYAHIKELRITCNTSITLSHVKVENIDQVIIENNQAEGSFVALAGSLRSQGSVTINAERFACSANIELEGDLEISVVRDAEFSATHRQVIDVNKFVVSATGMSPITFTPNLGTSSIDKFQMLRARDTILLETHGQITAINWSMQSGKDIVLAGESQHHMVGKPAALISFDMTECKTGGAVYTHAHVAEFSSSTLMAYDELNCVIRSALGMRTSFLFSRESMNIAAPVCKDEMSLIKSLNDINFNVDEVLSLDGTRVLAKGDISFGNDENKTRHIGLMRASFSQDTSESDQAKVPVSQSGEIYSLYGSIRARGKESIYINGLPIAAGSNIELSSDGNMVLETSKEDVTVGVNGDSVQDSTPCMLGGIVAGADMSAYFNHWFKEAVDVESSFNVRSSVLIKAEGILINELGCRAQKRITLSADEMIINRAVLESTHDLVLKSSLVVNGMDDAQEKIGKIFAKTIHINVRPGESFDELAHADFIDSKIINAGHLGGAALVRIQGDSFENTGSIDVERLECNLRADCSVGGVVLLRNTGTRLPSFNGVMKTLKLSGIMQDTNDAGLILKADEEISFSQHGVLITPSLMVQAPKVTVTGVIQKRLLLNDEGDIENAQCSVTVDAADTCTIGGVAGLGFDVLRISAKDRVDIVGTLTAKDGTIEVASGPVTISEGATVVFETSSSRQKNRCVRGIAARELINNGTLVVHDQWCPTISQIANNGNLVTLGLQLHDQWLNFYNKGSINTLFANLNLNSFIGGGALYTTLAKDLAVRLTAVHGIDIKNLTVPENAYIESEHGEVSLADVSIGNQLDVRGAPRGFSVMGSNRIGRLDTTEHPFVGPIVIDGRFETTSTKLNSEKTIELRSNTDIQASHHFALNATGGADISGNITQTGGGSVYILTPGTLTFRQSPDDQMATLVSNGLVVLSAGKTIGGSVGITAGQAAVSGPEGIQIHGFITTAQDFTAITHGELIVDEITIGGNAHLTARAISMLEKEIVEGNYTVITNNYQNPPNHHIGGLYQIIHPRYVDGYAQFIDPQLQLSLRTGTLNHIGLNESVVFFGDFVIIGESAHPFYWQSTTTGDFECHSSLLNVTSAFHHTGGNVVIGCAIEGPKIISITGDKVEVESEFEWVKDDAECMKRGVSCEPINRSLGIRLLPGMIEKKDPNSGTLKADVITILNATEVMLYGAHIAANTLHVDVKEKLVLIPYLEKMRRAIERLCTDKRNCHTDYTGYTITSIIPSIITLSGSGVLNIAAGDMRIVNSDLIVNGTLDVVNNGTFSLEDVAYYTTFGKDCGYHSTNGKVCEAGQPVYPTHDGDIDVRTEKPTYRKITRTALLKVNEHAKLTVADSFMLWGATVDFGADVELIVGNEMKLSPLKFRNDLAAGTTEHVGKQLAATDIKKLLRLGENALIYAQSRTLTSGNVEGVNFLDGLGRVQGTPYVSIAGTANFDSESFEVYRNNNPQVGGNRGLLPDDHTYLEGLYHDTHAFIFDTSGTTLPRTTQTFDEVYNHADSSGSAENVVINRNEFDFERNHYGIELERMKAGRKKFAMPATVVYQVQSVPLLIDETGGSVITARNSAAIHSGTFAPHSSDGFALTRNLTIVPEAFKTELYYRLRDSNDNLPDLAKLIYTKDGCGDIIDSLAVVNNLHALGNRRRRASSALATVFVDFAANSLGTGTSIAKAGMSKIASSIYDSSDSAKSPSGVVRGTIVVLNSAELLTSLSAHCTVNIDQEMPQDGALNPSGRELDVGRGVNELDCAGNMGTPGTGLSSAARHLCGFGVEIQNPLGVIIAGDELVKYPKILNTPVIVNVDGGQEMTEGNNAVYGVSVKRQVVDSPYAVRTACAQQDDPCFNVKTSSADGFIKRGKHWVVEGNFSDVQKGVAGLRLTRIDLMEIERSTDKESPQSVSTSLTINNALIIAGNVKDMLTHQALQLLNKVANGIASMMSTSPI